MQCAQRPVEACGGRWCQSQRNTRLLHWQGQSLACHAMHSLLSLTFHLLPPSTRRLRMCTQGLWRRQGDALRAAGGRPPHLHHPTQVSGGAATPEALAVLTVMCEHCAAADAQALALPCWARRANRLLPNSGSLRVLAPTTASLRPVSPTLNNSLPGSGRTTSRRCCGSGSSMSGCMGRWTAPSWRRDGPAASAVPAAHVKPSWAAGQRQAGAMTGLMRLLGTASLHGPPGHALSWRLDETAGHTEATGCGNPFSCTAAASCHSLRSHAL